MKLHPLKLLKMIDEAENNGTLPISLSCRLREVIVDWMENDLIPRIDSAIHKLEVFLAEQNHDRQNQIGV